MKQAATMKVHVVRADAYVTEVKTRLPFRYGVATMTEAPHVIVRLRIDLNGRPAEGFAADTLPPRWFTKNTDQTVDAELDEMATVIYHAVELARGKTVQGVFECWREIYEAQRDWGREQGYPPLLTNFGSSFIERALIHAVSNYISLGTLGLFQANVFGMRLDYFHPELQGVEPEALLPSEPLKRITVRHTIGLADYLEDADIPDAERLDDGLPQSLAASIDQYGLRHFKIKVTGALERDRERLHQITRVLQTHAGDDFAFSLDGNEQFETLDSFRDYWAAVREPAELRALFQHLLFVEQPFPRGVALDAEHMANLKDWSDRPPLLIDEADGELDSLTRALALGYVGTSHKNCKGVFRSVAHACLFARRRRENPASPLLLTGEDLASIGPVSMPQDLAVCAALGISSVERNGHHYFAGLSMMPPELQKKVLQHHETLYHPSRDGWPTLTIKDGQLDVTSVSQEDFGLGGWMGIRFFSSLEAWRYQRDHRDQLS